MAGFMIAGTSSGVGKTTVSMGIMAALSKKYNVQAFKVGPDYIDPAFHSYITGNPCSNLDSYMLEDKMIEYFYHKNLIGKDLAVIEGVMGIFDGAEVGSDIGTSAYIAKLLDIPVILVVDGGKVASSLAATVKGFAEFDDDLNLAGVIINNVGSEAHYQLLKEAIEFYTDVIPCGYLCKNEKLDLPERHLGLVPAEETQNLDEIFQILGDEIEKSVDLDRIIGLSNSGSSLSVDNQTLSVKENMDKVTLTGDKYKLVKTSEEIVKIIEAQLQEDYKLKTDKKGPRIAIAKDAAFTFYYNDSLGLLEDLYGVEWVAFSPINDQELPEDIAGVYFGGGFPEVFAKELEANKSMKESLNKALAAGLPYMAECGGLMYLCEALTLKDGQSYKMLGWLQGGSKMQSRLQRFGYSQVELLDTCVFGEKGQKIRVHEFHHSKIDTKERYVYEVTKTRKGQVTAKWNCGYVKEKGVAAYAHIHFGSNIDFGRSFVEATIGYEPSLGNHGQN